MRRLIISAEARRDAAAALRQSRASFGPQARDRYAVLLRTAYRDLQVDPDRLHTRHPIETLKVWTYAIRHSRERMTHANRVDRPRHLIAYTYDANTVRILRVLHDSMDLARHLDPPD